MLVRQSAKLKLVAIILVLDSDVTLPFLNFGGTPSTPTTTLRLNDDEVKGPIEISGFLPYPNGFASQVFVRY